MWFGITITLLILNSVDYCYSLSCTSQLQELSCLPAFSHFPSTRPKCYCTARCPDLEDLQQCSSGQLQIDPCGICLECAPGFSDKCGGQNNKDGMCAGGLACLIRYNPAAGEIEHNKTGTCVDASNDECKKFSRTVSCRPGQLGIPGDFPFCPAAPPRCSSSDAAQGQNRVQVVSDVEVSDSSSQTEGGTRRPKPIERPGTGFLFAALDSSPVRKVVEVVNNVRDSPSPVRQILDTVNGFLN